MVMGSDHIATSLAKGDAYFERPEFAFDHQFNAGASLVTMTPPQKGLK